MADEALTSLAALGALSDDDIFYVVDDPAISKTHHKVTAATILASLGGAGSCVTHTCGAVGWRASGGTIARTIVHETAFQLETGGDARGSYAIDLQQDRFLASDVAKGQYSAIFGGRENDIDTNAFYGENCSIVGSYNSIYEDTDNCHAIGSYNLIHGTASGSYYLYTIGQNIEAIDSQYGAYFGEDHEAQEDFSCFSFMWANNVWWNGTIGDYPVYCISMGSGNTLEGEVWETLQFGYDNWVGMAAVDGDVGRNIVFGDNCNLTSVWRNFAIGKDCLSLQSGLDDGYYGRILLSGDPANDKFDAGITGSGYNQDSWFSQNDRITTWNVAWTNSRFDFAILEDSIWYFEAFISGTEPGCTNSFAWKIEGLIENDGGVTTMLNSTVANVYRDVATKEWQAVADNVNDRLVLQFRDTGGPDATDCNIQLSMYTVEVGYS